ncbi:TetR/AcrR family transcriptional regulator [Actinoplanes solisilvae]|uniref:TetR/AcrR family transcriptional regulator n=1 Tax=Actinoplanes solisilvae TaxID=2486853 RepID=UPI000FDC9FB9|nr:TetR/AcrR family transcriptional regulator [Actinoplanes solisilvae]
MPRPTKQQIDDEILETAATLFARHGFKETSIQRIADAVGYSKTGLLHRYPTKESLEQAVVERGLRGIREVADEVAALPHGPARDRAAITSIARLAIDCPGIVSLLLAGLAGSDMAAALESIGAVVFEIFGADPETDPIRAVRVIGALGALAVAGVALREKPLAISVGDLIDVSYDALGHERPTPQ